MKTVVKILLLVLFSIGAIVGILVFAKTQVAPPSNIKLVDQYALNLKSTCISFDSIKDFNESYVEYSRLDDRLKRFFFEDAIDATVSDEYRKKIDETFGKNLRAYGLGLFQKSVWSEDQLNEILLMLSTLKSDKLTTGETAVSDEFLASADKINRVVGDYHAALRLSRSTSYNGVNDASSKIQKAKNYRSSEYLKNNASLVNALDALPGRIAQSHYGHVSSLVSFLGGYYNVSKDDYMNTLIPRADHAINEYKNAKIYGSSKPSVSELENRAVSLVTAAMNYYGDGN